MSKPKEIAKEIQFANWLFENTSPAFKTKEGEYLWHERKHTNKIQGYLTGKILSTEELHKLFKKHKTRGRNKKAGSY